MSLDSLIARDQLIVKDILTKPVEYMQRTYGLSVDTVYDLRQLYIRREIKNDKN